MIVYPGRAPAKALYAYKNMIQYQEELIMETTYVTYQGMVMTYAEYRELIEAERNS